MGNDAGRNDGGERSRTMAIAEKQTERLERWEKRVMKWYDLRLQYRRGDITSLQLETGIIKIVPQSVATNDSPS